ncbi:MAG: hypothetical protein ACYDAR_21425 [Thermomicrobiales bacterium]
MGLKRSFRFLGVTLAMTALLAFIAVAPVAADTTGATVTASPTTVTQRIINSDGTGSGGVVNFVANGFGPGEVVSIFITFPDGRVFPVVNYQGNILTKPACCPQADEALADGTGSLTFQLRFGVPGTAGSYPSTTGSLTDNTQYTNSIFFLPPEFANSVPPYGTYTVTVLGRVSLQKATATFTITKSATDDFSRNTTGTLTVFTTIGHKASAKQVDPQRVAEGSANPNVDIACNGLLPGESVAFWDTYPDGTVVALSTLVADDGGSAVLQLDLLTGKFPVGLHTFTCRGVDSNYTQTGAFLLLPGGITNQSAIGTLVCSYAGANQAVANGALPQLPGFFASDFLICSARDFRPNETVTFWQTFPNQTGHFLATIKANEAGVAVLAIQLFPGPIAFQNGNAVLGDAVLYQIAFPAGVDGRIPVGLHWISARGDSSGRIATTSFNLLPSMVDP